MANYFSNHSQSRFLANSATTNQANSAANSQAHNSPSTPTSAVASRSRLPSSKHFSTTVNTTLSSERSKESSPGTSSPNALAVHPLRNTYVRTLFCVDPVLGIQFMHRWIFWFRQQRTPGNKIVSYEEGIKKISAFSSVRYYTIVPEKNTELIARVSGRVILVSMDASFTSVCIATYHRLSFIPLGGA